MTNTINFHPATRPMWVLFSGDDGATFALMPGWATVESEDGFKWTALTWQNLHNFEAEVLDPDSHTLLRMWDSGTHPSPTRDEALAALRARKSDASADELEAVQADFQLCFPAPHAP